MAFIRTTAQAKISRLKKRVRVVQGGTSSSKTYSIIPIIIDICVKRPGYEASIVSATFPHLRRGAIKDFQKIMADIGFWSPSSWNKGESKYTFPNGSYIEFFSADQPGKVRGPRRDLLFINECNNLSFATYQQLQIRTNYIIYLDYNPEARFWVHKEVIPDRDTDMTILTYQDNEALTGALRNEILKAKVKAYYNPDLHRPKLFEEANIKSKYWHNWWKVYALGLTGSLEGIILDNWETISDLPRDKNGNLECRLIGLGLDFGFSSDPAAILEIYHWNGKRILNEVLYHTNMTNPDLAKVLPKSPVIIYADSAEPKSIKEIQGEGIQILGADKGPDSVRFGIRTMQEQEYLVTEGSRNLINELEQYRWAQDKDGNSLPKPVGPDHLIDALRYHEMMNLGSHSAFGDYHIPK